MKRRHIIIILLFASAIIAGTYFTNPKDQITLQTASNSKDNIKVIDNFKSPELNNTKTLRIYLPENYGSSNKRYPVIYMPDGQNLFNPSSGIYGKTWAVSETLDELYAKGKTKNYIVVGIDSIDSTRTNEYNVFSGVSNNNPTISPGGLGKYYSEFIVKTLKPYIDENYRTLPDKKNTAIIGASYGAIVSLYTGIEYNDVFGVIGAFSLCDNVNPNAYTEYLSDNLNNNKIKDTNIYFYVGTNDFAYYSANNAYKIATDNSLNNVFYKEDDGSHHESYWGPMFKWIIESEN
ncbi:MAG: alpha/beta hydrolase [Clostridiales bacterium]|nr:alpha/beta hydrolase [Clostridiales bacterium]